MLYYFTLINETEKKTLKPLFKKIEKLEKLIPSLPYSKRRILFLLTRFHNRASSWRGNFRVFENFSGEVGLFKDSKLANYLEEFIYFLFLKDVVENEETADGITIHYRQGRKVILCLDERDICSHWGNYRGLVGLAKRLLLLDHEEVVLLNVNRFGEFAKKNAKMHYLRRHIKQFARDFKGKVGFYDQNYL